MAPFMPNGKVANRFDKLLRWHSGSQASESLIWNTSIIAIPSKKLKLNQNLHHQDTCEYCFILLISKIDFSCIWLQRASNEFSLVLEEIEPFRGYIFKVVLKKTEVKGKTRENPWKKMRKGKRFQLLKTAAKTFFEVPSNKAKAA